MKLVIDIPDEAYDELIKEQHLPNDLDVEYFIIHGKPLQTVTNKEEAEAYPIAENIPISKEEQAENCRIVQEFLRDIAQTKDLPECKVGGRQRMTRLVDAEALRKVIQNDLDIGDNVGDDGYYNAMYMSLEYIDNAPTVEITEEQAIDKLHETGWMQRHDKEMTARPQADKEAENEQVR